jgi:hypothetical protein
MVLPALATFVELALELELDVVPELVLLLLVPVLVEVLLAPALPVGLVMLFVSVRGVPPHPTSVRSSRKDKKIFTEHLQDWFVDAGGARANPKLPIRRQAHLLTCVIL